MQLSDKIFHDDEAARLHLEALRWPDGPYCPNCGECEKITRLQGKSTAPGMCICKSCRKKFTVTVGTLFERSHIGLAKWMLGFRLMASSKKGISAHQLGRTLGLTYKSAWFMAHRIREAMTESDGIGPFGRGGATVEVDETFIGTDTDYRRDPGKQRGIHDMMKVVALIERETGRARTFVVDSYSINAIVPRVEANLHYETNLITDESSLYTTMGRGYASHQTVNHKQKNWVSKSDPTVHTNTIEGFFGVFKRGMRGVYQHCGKQHLNRYMTEFAFRYSFRTALGVTDTMRTDEALRGITGKRLTYRRIGEARYA